MRIGTDPHQLNGNGDEATVYVDSGSDVVYSYGVDSVPLGTLSAGQSAFVTQPVWVRSLGSSEVHIFEGFPVKRSSAAAADVLLSSTILGDSYPRFQIDADGTLLYGDGTAAVSYVLTQPAYVMPDPGSSASNTATLNALLQLAKTGARGISTVMLRATAYSLNAPAVVPTGVTLSGHYHRSQLQLAPGANCNVIQSENWGSPTTFDNDIRIENLFIDGKKASQTLVFANTIVTANVSLSTSPTTVSVIDTTDFPSAGKLWVGSEWVTYTGKTSTSFTGCTATRSTTMRKGAWVHQADSVGHGIAMQAARSVVANCWVRGTIGSGYSWQGSDPGGAAGYCYENRMYGFLRADWCGRFGLEIGENTSDSHVHTIVPGISENLTGSYQSGAILIRSGDWTFDSIHPVGWFVPTGSFGFAPYKQAAIVIAASETTITRAYCDLAPGTTVTIDTTISGGGELNNIEIPSIRSFKGGMLSPGHGLLLRGESGNGAIKRVKIGPNFHSPLGYAVASGPLTKLCGAQAPNALVGNKLQLMSTRDFALNSTIGGVVSLSTDSLAYTGKQESSCYTTSSAAIDAGTINVNSTAGFDAAGIIVSVVPNGFTFSVMEIAYSGKTATSFTGCTWTPISGSKALIPSGLYGGLTQDFLTGVSGGLLGSQVDQTTVRQPGLQPDTLGLEIVAPLYRSLRYGRHNMKTGDIYEVLGGMVSELPMNATGQVTFPNGGATSVPVAHNLPDVPAVADIRISPAGVDTQGCRVRVSAVDATNITFAQNVAAAGADVVWNWSACVK